MARNRMIKPDFWDDEKLSKISRDARLTFIGLWTYSDDMGVVKGNLKWLQNKIFPYDDIKATTFKKWIDELSNLRFIMPFTSNNESYIHIKNFPKHQTINNPSKTGNPQPTNEVVTQYYGSINEVLPPKRKEDNISKEKQFEEFWNLYDKKISKDKVHKKFLDLSEEDIQKILAFLPNYLNATPNKQYRKNPETFLNNKAWLDEIPSNGIYESPSLTADEFTNFPKDQ